MAKLDMLIDAVDAKDRVVGHVARRQALGRDNFRVVHVLALNHRGDVLLQQIAPGQRHSGSWGSSAAGYLQAGETYVAAAQRKLFEELAVTAVDLEHLGQTSMNDQGSIKFIGVFTAQLDGITRASSPEVSAVEYVSLANIQSMIANGTRPLTPTFLQVLQLFVQRQGSKP